MRKHKKERIAVDKGEVERRAALHATKRLLLQHASPEQRPEETPGMRRRRLVTVQRIVKTVEQLAGLHELLERDLEALSNVPGFADTFIRLLEEEGGTKLASSLRGGKER
jgi:hypothetical protein